MFLSALLLPLLCFVSSLGSPICSSLLNSKITLVENSTLEFGCRLDSEFTQCSLVNQFNVSQECSFGPSLHGMTNLLTNPFCTFGRRLSFIGNFKEKRCRFRIDPVLTTGNDFINLKKFQVISTIYSSSNLKVLNGTVQKGLYCGASTPTAALPQYTRLFYI